MGKSTDVARPAVSACFRPVSTHVVVNLSKKKKKRKCHWNMQHIEELLKSHTLS